MLKCEEATRLASDGLDRHLSMKEAVSLRVHLLACGACSNFNRQIKLMGTMSRRYARRQDEDNREG